MTPQKIVSLIESYEEFLALIRVPKIRMDQEKSFGSLSSGEILAHAHFLCDDAKKYATNPEQFGKANRHLTAIQMCLSFANIYTLGELMDHNRPEVPEQKTTA